MFKTIKAKTIFMQIIMMLVMIGIVFVLFAAFFDEYYFSRKLEIIEQVYDYLEETDIGSLKYNDKVLVRHRDQNIKMLITDENFQSIFKQNSVRSAMQQTTEKETKAGLGYNVDWGAVDAKIDRYIVQNIKNYKEELTLKNKKHRICGYGIITQNNKKYYVYIYETKVKVKIGFEYNKIFLLITDVLAVFTGIIVAIWISNKISRPIKQIESTARQAIDNNFEAKIDEKQEFQELAGLSKSINIMLAHIRQQMQSLEEEIEQKTIVEEKRRHFVNNVSHEMKTPLAIISSQVEMLQLIDDEKKKIDYCKSISEEITNMSDMINDMIVIYSAQSDNETMMLEETDIGELVKETCIKYKDLFDRNNLILQLDMESNCQAKVNRRYISQAVDNYVTNSVKHSTDNDKVHVRVVSNNDYVRIEVENQGPHIPEEHKEQIWDMFFKGDDGETLNGQKGSGLGLYLVKSIVELHKGNCGFKNIEKGIIFWIEIPKG